MNHVRRITDLFGNDEEEMEEADGDEHQLEYLQEKKNKKEERKKELWRFRNQVKLNELWYFRNQVKLNGTLALQE